MTFDLEAFLAAAAPLPGGWQPTHDDVVVLPLKAEDRTAGGLVIAEEHQDRPQKGVVVAVGPGAWTESGDSRVPMDVRVGDLVLYGQFAGRETAIEGTRFLLMRDRECNMRRPQGAYTLTCHVTNAGDALLERRHYHEAGTRCELCPRETSAVIEEERRRIVAAANAELRQHEDLGDQS